MFTHVVVEPTENSPPTLECAFNDCDCTYPFDHGRVWAWTNQHGKMQYASFCSWRCSLKAFNPQVMWRA